VIAIVNRIRSKKNLRRKNEKGGEVIRADNVERGLALLRGRRVPWIWGKERGEENKKMLKKVDRQTGKTKMSIFTRAERQQLIAKAWETLLQGRDGWRDQVEGSPEKK